MTQTAVLKRLRVVPAPITECLMEPPISINLPFQEPVSSADSLRTERQVMEPLGEPALEDTLKSGELAEETAEKSPLLALAGTLECDLSAIEPAPVAELRVVPQDPELAKHATTPLLALAGTLECNVLDFGKRHDEYIGDALIAELRGEHDD